MKMLRSVIASLILFAASALADSGEKIGVSTALTGDAAAFGNDIKNALIVANDALFEGKYRLVFEDEQCKAREAIAAAQKFISIDKVKFVLGFPCNQTLFATAPIYEKAGVTVISSSATSGDVLDMGKGIFRLFPTDAGAAAKLFSYASKRSKSILILTEQDEFPTMMERTFKRLNAEAGAPMKIVSESFVQGETDLKALLLRSLKGDIDSIYLNTNTETSFISAVKQLRALRISKAVYGAYHPASIVVRSALGKELDGIVFSNLAGNDQIASEAGRKLLVEFRRRFGEPQAGFPVVPIAMESLRILDLALKSGEDPVRYLTNRTFSGGLIPEYTLDEHGAVQGISFEIQRIDGDNVVVVDE